MSKSKNLKTLYTCQNCGAQTQQWQGKCSQCNSWNSFSQQGYGAKSEQIKPSLLSDIALANIDRMRSGSDELDRVLGGGLVPGSVILIGGDPGIGKSTLLLQTMCHLSDGLNALYVTGEESLEQVRLRAEQIKLTNAKLGILAQTNLEKISAAIDQQKPDVLVIDSIQTIYSSEEASGIPGSVSQVKYATTTLVQKAKQDNIITFLIGHVTKEGQLAGPRVLEHMVDTVLYFEGENDARFRVIRAIKNRFGAVNELGVFTMTDGGIRDVPNPSAIFLSGRQATPGGTIMICWEGTRPLLVEVQSLVAESYGAQPRRVALGLDTNRLALILAVLQRHGGILLHQQDVYTNVVGGLKIQETASDLALIAALLSSHLHCAIPKDVAIFGEIGLSGEIRPVPHGQQRIQEAAKHGISHVIIPQANAKGLKIKGVKIQTVGTIKEAVAIIKAIMKDTVN